MDVISEELLKTQKNVEHTNVEIGQAATLQKKARKKYVILALIIVLVVLLGVGLIIIYNNN